MRKLIAMLLAVAGFAMIGGCATPGYSGGENVSRTLRTWDYESKQLAEDIMYEGMLIPPSRSTQWNLR